MRLSLISSSNTFLRLALRQRKFHQFPAPAGGGKQCITEMDNQPRPETWCSTLKSSLALPATSASASSPAGNQTPRRAMAISASWPRADVLNWDGDRGLLFQPRRTIGL